MKRIIRDEKIQMLALFAVFIVWFVIDSVCFANPDMPALRARQMLSFPCGVALALNKSRIEYMLSKLRNMSIITLFGGDIMYTLHGNNTIRYCKKFAVFILKHNGITNLFTNGSRDYCVWKTI